MMRIVIPARITSGNGKSARKANPVLLVFAFLALFPFPLVILAGITILIIWHYHRRDLLTKSG